MLEFKSLQFAGLPSINEALAKKRRANLKFGILKTVDLPDGFGAENVSLDHHDPSPAETLYRGNRLVERIEDAGGVVNDNVALGAGERQQFSVVLQYLAKYLDYVQSKKQRVGTGPW